jgi:four helix bundle protein
LGTDRLATHEDFRTLEVWQKAHALSIAVYKNTASFPVDERFGLTSQIRRCCVSVEANIAEVAGEAEIRIFEDFF